MTDNRGPDAIPMKIKYGLYEDAFDDAGLDIEKYIKTLRLQLQGIYPNATFEFHHGCNPKHNYEAEITGVDLTEEEETAIREKIADVDCDLFNFLCNVNDVG